MIYHPLDDSLVAYRSEEGMNIEPDFYVPILPMVLVNGSEGIGTGWSSFVFNYNPSDIVANLVRKIDGGEFVDMTPWYRGFKGTIEHVGEHKYSITGAYEIVDETTMIITELPIGMWTQTYKEFLEELLEKGGLIKVCESM
jgi:DNA topoisomerase-2